MSYRDKKFVLFINGFNFILCFIIVLCTVREAFSLAIIRNYLKPGEAAPGTSYIAGEQQATAVGEGNLIDIFNTACNMWEDAILDEFTMTINYGWAPTGGGEHYLISQGGNPNRETEGTILFNNTSSNFQYWLDPTPRSNEEYLTYTEYSDDLGAGEINTGRVFSDALWVAPTPHHFDLLSTALHEIGHSLGISNGNYSFSSEKADGDVDLTEPRPYAGSSIPLATNIYGPTSHPYIGFGPVMASAAGQSRRLLSEVDILLNAEISKLVNLNLNPYSIPEPSTMSLIFAGILSLILFNKRKRYY